jgi:hypothetical protein
MKKYILVMIMSLVSLISFNITQAQTATNENDACNNKKNGDACSYSNIVSTGSNAPTTQTINGYCDRRGTVNDSIFGGGNFYCNREVNGWKDCAFPGDACELNGQLGVCPSNTSRGQGTCDTTKKPSGNPGGSSPSTCGQAPCAGNKVCVNQGGVPTCTDNAATTDGKCGQAPCAGNKVCVNQGGVPTCTDNASTPGTPANNTPTDASSPQTVSFINPSRFNSIIDLVAGVINALLGILGAITVAVLVLSGFKYMTSSNPGEVGAALDGIRNAIVGLMIIMGAFLITQYVISALAG